MTPEELLLEWKEAYGYVYYTEISGNEFVYRLLSYLEYIDIKNKAEDTLEMDEMICRLCVLDPEIEDWEEGIYAGYTATIGQLVREESLITPKEDGSSDVKVIISEKSEELSTNLLLQIPLVIKRCFTEYTLDEIERMSLPRQLELYTKAAWMLQQFEGVSLAFNEE